MTDTAELVKRKKDINLAVVYADPDAFLAHFGGWLEITAFISALRAGEVQAPADGVTPALTRATTEKRRRRPCRQGRALRLLHDISAERRQDRSRQGRGRPDRAFRQGFSRRLGACGASGRKSTSPCLWKTMSGKPRRKCCSATFRRRPCAPRKTGAPGCAFSRRRANPISRRRSCIRWRAGPRDKWADTLEKGVAFLHHIEDNVPVLREVLAETAQ